MSRKTRPTWANILYLERLIWWQGWRLPDGRRRDQLFDLYRRLYVTRELLDERELARHQARMERWRARVDMAKLVPVPPPSSATIEWREPRLTPARQARKERLMDMGY